MNEIFLCAIKSMAELNSLELTVNVADGVSVNIFIIKNQNSEYHAYLNKCPHTGISLNWLENQFLSSDLQEIQCATHNARFNKLTGACLSGPCSGKGLTKLTVKVVNDQIFWLYESSDLELMQ